MAAKMKEESVGLAAVPTASVKDVGALVPEANVMVESTERLDLAIGIGLARAEAEVYAAESMLSMFESRVRMVASSVARLRVLALQVGLRQPEPIKEAPPIDDLTVARARRMLARGGFVRTS